MFSALFPHFPLGGLSLPGGPKKKTLFFTGACTRSQRPCFYEKKKEDREIMKEGKRDEA
jgi:hypothetical protein